MGFLKDFKTFAVKGNLADLAIGVVIGAAFGKVITAFIEGCVMPIIAAIVGKNDFSEFFIQIGGAKIMYGTLITAIIDFLIIALVCYWVIKNLMKKDPNAVPGPGNLTEVLLTEIRDSLKK